MTESPPTHRIHPQIASLAVPVDNLTPDPRNARLHDDRNAKSIRDSYAAHGQRKPIVVQRIADDGTTNVVRAGNGQLAAARALGWTHIAAVFVDDDDRQAVAYALRDNRTAELAEWDLAILGGELRILKDDGFDLSEVGWEPYEADPLMAANWSPPTNTGEDFVVPDKRVSLMFSSEQWDEMKSLLNAKPTAEDVLVRMRAGKVQP